MVARVRMLREFRGEKKVIGNWMSMRQALVLGGGLTSGGIAAGIMFIVVRLAGLTKGAALGVAVVPAVILFGASVAWGFLPAGWMGVLPGPDEPESEDPHEPQMRLDQWLTLLWAFRRKRKWLPYRRSGYESLAPLYSVGKGKRSQ